MVGICVTEPDVGSDVASVKCRAERRQQDGGDVWVINGPKSWCTFAGRANVLALLARTDPDASKGAKGLSLFIVPKDRFDGHEFEMKQPGGGRLVGKADATPGYRGMHSFTLNFENYVVPAENLVGGEAGDRAGLLSPDGGLRRGPLADRRARLRRSRRRRSRRPRSTSSTACSSGSRSSSTSSRSTRSGGWRRTLAAARADHLRRGARHGRGRAQGGAARRRRPSCSPATSRSRSRSSGQLMHGGWGYAEEYPISRYVVDAQVLPIFEGVKPILELKVVARSLLSE